MVPDPSARDGCGDQITMIEPVVEAAVVNAIASGVTAHDYHGVESANGPFPNRVGGE